MIFMLYLENVNQQLLNGLCYSVRLKYAIISLLLFVTTLGLPDCMDKVGHDKNLFSRSAFREP